MFIDFDWFSVVDVSSPSNDCVHVVLESSTNPDIKRKHFVVFERQIKYVIVDEHIGFKRLKLYIRGNEKYIKIDFKEEIYDLLEKFLKAVYNR